MSARRLAGAAARPRSSAADLTPDPSAMVPAGPAAACPSISEQSSETRLQGWRLILRVFVPFTAAFFLSYLFRAINALISSELSSEFALDAADLGFLTSVYFLAFAALQLPVGIWLDRYGPRRVQAALLLLAAAGAVLFSMSAGFAALTLGRALIGIGVAAAFTGGLKAIALWFPKDRVAIMNGYLLTLGALGGVTATSPAKLLLDWSGSWRGLFVILAAITVACALTIWSVVPESRTNKSPSKKQAPASLKTVYCDPRFWQIAPLSATCAGTTWALQSLWAAPWLTDVDGLTQADVTLHLFVMAIALSVAALLLGTAADRLRRRGIGPQIPLGVVATMVIAAQLALILRWPVPSWLSWSLVAATGSAPVLSYAILAEGFPKEITGRANGALNLLHFGGAFAIQYIIGVILALWPSQGGHYPAIAYQIAFGFNLCLQAAALAWFAMSQIRGRGSILVGQLRRSLLARIQTRLRSGTRFGQMAKLWVDRLIAVDRHASLWRVAGLASASLAALLGFALAVSAVRANVTAPPLPHPRHAAEPSVEPATHSEAQIAYMLARFIKNVRSLSVDPVIVRANWIDALDQVTSRGAQMLNSYAHDENPFAKIGRHTVTVAITDVTRTSGDTFGIRWEEQTIEAGALVKTARFMGVVTVIFQSPTTAGTISTNPLGLYVDRFRWWRNPAGDAAT
jgi:type IV secretory pathway TrbF-like protein/predicted MFS family arabinose efflux permease